MKFNNLAALPMAIVLVLIAWDIIMLSHYSFTDYFIMHLAFLVFAIIFSALAILWHGTEGEAERYLEGLIQPNRSAMVGFSAFIIGSAHFITFAGTAPIYLLIGYLLMLLAYCETASISNRFRDHFTRGGNIVSKETVVSLLATRMVILGMAFLFSIMGLYMALMGVVGFTSVWSVLIFACILFLILIIIIKHR